MRIIVAIDVIEGKCVRLTKGDFATKKIYNDDPLDLAKQVEDHGIRYIHLVDLDGTRKKRVINYRTIEKIASGTSLIIDFGGGIRSENDIHIAFGSGATQVTCGSIALTEKPRVIDWLKKYGQEKIILGADSLKRKVAVEGWSERSETEIYNYISGYRSEGMKYIVCTDIDRDGMLEGPATDLYKDLLEIEGINLIASGGISSIADLGLLSGLGCEGAIVGKALYEGKIGLKELCRLC